MQSVHPGTNLSAVQPNQETVAPYVYGAFSYPKYKQHEREYRKRRNNRDERNSRSHDKEHQSDDWMTAHAIKSMPTKERSDQITQRTRGEQDTDFVQADVSTSGKRREGGSHDGGTQAQRNECDKVARRGRNPCPLGHSGGIAASGSGSFYRLAHVLLCLSIDGCWSSELWRESRIGK
jgi:hypothetical protein